LSVLGVIYEQYDSMVFPNKSLASSGSTSSSAWTRFVSFFTPKSDGQSSELKFPSNYDMHLQCLSIYLEQYILMLKSEIDFTLEYFVNKVYSIYDTLHTSYVTYQKSSSQQNTHVVKSSHFRFRRVSLIFIIIYVF